MLSGHLRSGRFRPDFYFVVMYMFFSSYTKLRNHVEIKLTGSEVRLPGFKSQFSPSLALEPWSNYFDSLKLSFLIYKTELTIGQ